MTKLLFILLFLFLFGCSPTEPEEETLCDENIEVELWGTCYNIEETTELDLYNWRDTIINRRPHKFSSIKFTY